jgi:hypothetical protein
VLGLFIFLNVLREGRFHIKFNMCFDTCRGGKWFDLVQKNHKKQTLMKYVFGHIYWKNTLSKETVLVLSVSISIIIQLLCLKHKEYLSKKARKPGWQNTCYKQHPMPEEDAVTSTRHWKIEKGMSWGSFIFAVVLVWLVAPKLIQELNPKAYVNGVKRAKT